jgi:peptide/nickel transport system substrate-binding protein
MSLGRFSRRTAILYAAALTAGCASRGNNSGGAAAGPPRRGGSITVQQPFEPRSGLNFLVSDDPSLMLILSGTVYSKLIELRVGKDVNNVELVPDLATDWKVSDDGLTYTFNLRNDVTWQNTAPVNGRPFTADDVVATFEGLKASKSPHKWMAEPIDSIKADGEHRVVFTLSHPYAPLLQYMAHHFNVILPREGVEGKFDLGKTAIGTGPFMLDSHRPNVEYVLKRNPNYYEKDKPYLDEIRMPIISDTSAVTAALRSNRLDVGGQPFDVIESTFRKNRDFTISERPADFVSFDINMTQPPFTDLRVRRAVLMAVDWENMGKATRGKMNYTTLLRPEITPAAITGDDVRKLRPYDPNRARQMLAEAGYPNGFQTNMLVQQLSDADVREGEWVVADLAKVGIDAKITVLDPSTAVGRRRDHQFGLSKAARSVIFPDQTIQDYRTGSSENYSAISDPKVDQMIADSRTTLDEKARDDLYRQFQVYMETQVAASVLPIQYFQFWAVNKRVQNYYQSPIYHGRRYADMWVTG